MRGLSKGPREAPWHGIHGVFGATRKAAGDLAWPQFQRSVERGETGLYAPEMAMFDGDTERFRTATRRKH